MKDIHDAWGINATVLGVTDAQEKTVQYRECPNRGNCTLPDTCTCEKGWEGEDCTVPICAQECLNGGSRSRGLLCTRLGHTPFARTLSHIHHLCVPRQAASVSCLTSASV